MTDTNIRNLAAAITLQAVKDYFDENVTDAKRKVILKDLRSAHMDFITNGMSIIVAEQLEKHPEEIAERLRRHSEDMI